MQVAPPSPTARLGHVYDHADHAYLDLVRHVRATGVRKTNRTGTDTISSFAAFYTVDLQAGYPLLTTKKVYFNSMWREVLWYLSGADHIRELRQHTKIWDAWADADGNLETAYGRFWRRFPIPAEGAWLGNEVFAGPDHPTAGAHVHTEADGSLSFDQIGYVRDELRRNPMSRRLVVSAWHPANAAVSKLPPCHYTFCFNVEPRSQGPDLLHCHLTQRSADIALGVPFNLACYALLTQALAQDVGMAPGRFAHTLIDAHLYVDHLDGLEDQLGRAPRPMPTLTLAEKPLDALAFEDATLTGYDPHPAIRFPVAV